MAYTSTAVNLLTNCCYEVFLNHRGSDTKRNIASHLYRGLFKQYGFRVFWDKEEMQVGDDLTSQIQDAIKNASVHVAIFSPRYAESIWCLQELHLMVQSGKPIIPVFYKIEPGELKRTHGDYAKALQEHGKKTTYESQPRYNSTTIGNWRTALYTVAETSGLELEKFNGDEGELVDAVVDSVCRKLGGTRRLDVAEHPTGLDKKIKHFEKKVLSVQSDKPRVIGIVGMGGIGKTTLVKELFNRKKSQYSKYCFLADVSENARKTSLESLQKKLLECLTQRNETIGYVSEGVQVLKCRLRSFQALVILDDVDHDNQLKALLSPIRDVLHSNSLILITSRDRDVLKRSRVEASSIYQLTGLNPQQSRELFCLHAFTQPHPVPGFEPLVHKFLKACDRLPLSLKVFGGLLYGNDDKSFWEEQLERLQQILPEDIKTRLKVSYDLLQADEKQMFLDIACFFIGERRDKAIRIWEGCGLKGPRVVFRSLLNKNLVELEERVGFGVGMEFHFYPEIILRMHYHVRDLGRHLANNPSLPRRIWRKQDFEDMLEQSSVETEVRGISIPWTEMVDPSFLPGFKIRNLQLLDCNLAAKYGIMNAVQSPNLIWLRTNACAYSRLLSSFPLTKLRVLEISSKGRLQSLWHEGSQAPLQLRELTIKGGEALVEVGRLPDALIHLELGFCPNLRKIEWLTPSKLQRLMLYGCDKLEQLPSLETLVSLEELLLFKCSKLRSIRGLAHLTKLRTLSVLCCLDLEEPVGVEQLRASECLIHVYGCPKLPGSTMIAGWQAALYNLYYWKFNGHEGELVDAVVDSVCRKLRGTRQLDVAEHPIVEIASTSTAVNLPTNCCYEVFLNHRGSDTKKDIASRVYCGLLNLGFRVFWDKDEMQVGDDLTCQIQDAIKTASVHVPIFSPHYAESKWCLEELHLMVQSGKPIIPVFYKIEPGELKRAKGDYAKALRQHGKKKTYDSQPRCNSTTIGNWRTALSTVAKISGLELDKFNGVDSVRRNLRVDVAEHPTGLDDKIEDFENKVSLVQSDKPRDD